MKSLVLAAMLAFTISTPIAYAQEVSTTIEQHKIESPVYEDAQGEVQVKPATAEQVFGAVSNLITAKTAGVLAIVFAAIQLAMAWIKSQFNMIGRYRILTLIGLSIVGGTIGGMLDGGSFAASLAMGLLIVPPQITVSQILKQVGTKKGDT